MKGNLGKPVVGILMGSDSDWPVMKAAADVCAEFGIPHEARVISAHRTPQELSRYAGGAHRRGLRVIIAGAGGAAHLPGVAAALTPLPVIGVPIESKALKGLDSLLAIVQMPAGFPWRLSRLGEGATPVCWPFRSCRSATRPCNENSYNSKRAWRLNRGPKTGT